MTITTTNLKSLVQADLDALTALATPADLQKATLKSHGLGLDRSNLIAIIESKIATSNAQTSEADLIALNSARAMIDLPSIRNVGDTIMSTKSGVEFTNALGERYLKAGFLETNVSELDPSIIRDGLYFEPLGSVEFSSMANGEVTISDTGVIFEWSYSQDYYRRRNNANENYVQTQDFHGSNNYIQSLVTNHNGVWMSTGNSNNTYVKRSTDDGATFENLTFRPVYATRIYYDHINDVWIAIQRTSQDGLADGKIFVSNDDGDTWQEVFSSLDHNVRSFTNLYVFPPTSANPYWHVVTKANSAFAQVYRGTSDGMSWSLVLVGSQVGKSSQKLTHIWGMNGKVYYNFSESALSAIEATEGHALNDVDSEFVIYASDIGLASINIPAGEVVYFNGAYHFQNGLQTLDGKTFKGADHRDTANYIQASPTSLYSDLGNFGTNPGLKKSVPVAGSPIAYYEGDASQFVMISKE